MPAIASKSLRNARLPRVELYRLLADVDRLRILTLCAEEELSVGELGLLLDDSQPQVSRKIAPLRQAGLLSVRRSGTRTLLRTQAEDAEDAVLRDALAEGRKLCLADGSLARVPEVVAAREEVGLALFRADPAGAGTTEPPAGASTVHLAHLAALSAVLPGRALAVDVGTGDGLLLDVLSPLYERVLAVDRSQARLTQCAARVAARGFRNVSLFPSSYDDTSLMERVDALGGADLVFAARTLHHASRPAQAISAFARLLRKGGHLAVLEYLPHEDESMRQTQGDVWLGFSPDELRSQLEQAGLEIVGQRALPDAYHREGPDTHLGWHTVVARRPLLSSSSVSIPRGPRGPLSP